jgi:hypothetical protein
MPIKCPPDDVLRDIAIGAVSDALAIPPDQVPKRVLDLSDPMDAIDIAGRIGRVLGLPGLTNGKLQRKLQPAQTIPEIMNHVRDYAKTV